MSKEKINTRKLRALQGGVIALGAPLGWLLIATFPYWGAESFLTQIDQNLGVYLYMFLGTITAFSIFGYTIGSHEDRLNELVLIEPLTQIYNSRFFRRRLKNEFSRAQRSDRPVALLLIDLDRFKTINDKHGHPTGDDVLIAIADSFKKVLRAEEIVARVGGDEFAVIVPDTSLEKALAVAERLRDSAMSVSVPSRTHDDSIHPAISIGVAMSLQIDSSKADDLYVLADKALYSAKEAGRNRIAQANL